MHDLGDAQDVGRRALLGDARGGELLRRHVRILGALATVGGHDVVDPRPRRGQLRDGGRGEELGVVRVADHDECALQRADQLVALEGAHAGMLPRFGRALD